MLPYHLSKYQYPRTSHIESGMTVYRLKFHFVLHKLEMLQTIDMG